MNPNRPPATFGQAGFQQQQFPHGQMMMPQGQMMSGQGQFVNQGHGHFMNQGQGQMMMRPPGFNNQMMGMQMRPSVAPPSYNQTVTQRTPGVQASIGPRPGISPPSYNHALNQGMARPQNSLQGRPGNRSSGKSEEQIQKEKYFQQQQAKLKQFGKSSSAPTLDPNKLVDSIFGEQPTPKPKVNKTQEDKRNLTVTSQPATVETDDSFGDFLSSPASMVPISTSNIDQQNTGTSQTTVNSNIVTTTQSVTMATQPSQVKPEKKDLTKMMFESCDLNAPQKAKHFQKPTLKEINPVHTTAPLHHTSHAARRWDNSQELSNLFIQEAVKDEKTLPKQPAKHTSPTSKHPPKPPPWLTDDTLLPPLYKQVLEACVVEGQIQTDRLYPILVLSGLPKEVLGQLWSLCNKTTPGQLIIKELYQLLAAIALTQNNFKVETLDILRRCPQPPVPFLLATGAPAPSQQVVVMPQSPNQVLNETQVPSSQFSQSPPIQSGAQIPVQTIGQSQSLPHGQPGSAPAHVIQAPAAQNFNQPLPSPFPSHLAGNQATSMTPSMTSSPATLPVTQLPPAGLSAGVVGNVVSTGDDDDDFADFQGAGLPAPPTQPTHGSVSQLVKETSESVQSPVKDPSKFVFSGTKAEANIRQDSLSPQDIKHSSVENFFGSDDSSEVSSTPTVNRKVTASPDDYFDGYKSADSKPSDSTSQFSTDQSEGEDFKNFENYLDEFQRKKEQQEKESPLHRPISKFLTKDPAPTSTNNFVRKPTTPVKKLPTPVSVKQPVQVTVPSSDEFSDFADFQSAPVVKAEDQSNPLNAAASAIDLIGDEDKYAALRTLDFSSPPDDNEPDLMGEPVSTVKPTEESDENWADFQTASGDTDQAKESTTVTPVSNSNLEADFSKSNTNEDSDWAAFETASEVKPAESGSDWSGFHSTTMSDTKSTFPASGIDTVAENGTEIGIGKAKLEESNDWAEFQCTEHDYAGFQSSDNVPESNKGEAGLVNVKKDRLDANEILGLFKVKEEPLTEIKSRDDDVNFPSKPQMSLSENMDRMHGIMGKSSINEGAAPIQKTKQKHFSEEDDFMKPPPMEDFPDDDQEDFGGYSRGYDFDDIIKPKVPEKKTMYGMYGINDTFVVEGHKKEGMEAKSISIEVTKDSDVDNDSDSVSSKDNEMFRGKFGLGKVTGEDSQSVASLELVVNRSLQNVRDADGGDNQSVCSNDFGNFEVGVGKDALPESKSLDSLDLRKEDAVETGSSQDNSDKETKEDTPASEQTEYSKPVFEVGVPGSGLPIIGDRYSAIMHDVPGSDKHAYEWKRCLDNCCRMIQDANNIFNSISSSSVCNEVIKSSQGSLYIQGVIEIYRVVCKITVTMKKSGIHSDQLTQLLKDIDLAWNNLTAFLVGGAVMPDDQSLEFSHGALLDDDTTSQYKACGVCLLNVEMKTRGVDPDNDNARLTYGGRQYHAPCANFWINCVDSTLPALKLPELL